MATRTWIWLGLLIAAAGSANSTSAQSLERFTFAEPRLGTIVELTIYAPEETVANEAAKLSFARITELDRIFSDYKPDSEAMRLCEQAGMGQTVKVSRELFDVLKLSLLISKQTDGAFDVTIGPLVQLWRRAKKEKRIPPADQILAAKALVDWKQVTLNEAEQSVELKRAGMRLDFGAIAKGYIAQDVSRLLRERGCARSLVAVAGDIVANEPPPDADGWLIKIEPLKDAGQSRKPFVRLKNQSISTSGDAFQFVEIGGVRYSHIVDPRTGVGLTERSSVSVISNDGAIADAYATAICVLGPERGLALTEKNPQIGTFIARETPGGIQIFESNGFRTFEAK